MVLSIEAVERVLLRRRQYLREGDLRVAYVESVERQDARYPIGRCPIGVESPESVLEAPSELGDRLARGPFEEELNQQYILVAHVGGRGALATLVPGPQLGVLPAGIGGQLLNVDRNVVWKVHFQSLGLLRGAAREDQGQVVVRVEELVAEGSLPDLERIAMAAGGVRIIESDDRRLAW